MARRLVVPGLIVAAGVALVAAARLHYEQTLDVARERFRAESHEQAVATARQIENRLQQVHQGLRTIARLPGVRNVSRHAENFDGDARQSVQEIYNNLATTVAMSEVYIVPLDLDPDAIDPVTGEKQAPITTFDELIVGKTGASDEGGGSGHAGEHAELEEIEIFEYRLMRAQLDWWKAHTPTEASVPGLELPAISGPEVVTCDNSRFSPDRPNDADRSGLVYSVPFFGPDGALKGQISGVLLSHALRDMIPGGDLALVRPESAQLVHSHDDGVARASHEAVAALRADPALIHSEVLSLAVRDAAGPWLLWAGAPNERFWARGDVRNARQSALVSAMAIVLATVGVLAMRAQQERHRRFVSGQSDELSRCVERATADVRRAVDAMRGSSHEVVTASSSLADASRSIRDNAERTASLAQVVSTSADDASRSVATAATELGELTERVDEISRRTAEAVEVSHDAAREVDAASDTVRRLGESGHRIERIVRMISAIAGQTHLLALNATIEAARVGEAGRGFIVVANEVKDLARATESALTEIDTELGSIVRDTNETVSVIASIGAVIHRIRDGQAAIATAVELQSASTRQIDWEVAMASRATADIAESISNVASAAGETMEGVRATAGVVSSLESASAALEAIVDEIGAGPR